MIAAIVAEFVGAWQHRRAQSSFQNLHVLSPYALLFISLQDRADQSSTAVPMETECHVEAHAPSHVVEAESQVVEPQVGA